MSSKTNDALGAFHVTTAFEPLGLPGYSKNEAAEDSLDPVESGDGSCTSPNESFRRSSYSSESSLFLSDSDPLSVDSDKPCYPHKQPEIPNLVYDHSEVFSAQYAFLKFMEPVPVSPPLYSSLPPGGCPKYHVMETLLENDELPSYKPAVYKIGVACRKVEWLSPYEVSLNRSWKNTVIELNSTQLNIYQIPQVLEGTLAEQQDEGDFDDLDDLESIIDQKLISVVTTKQDAKFRKLCDSVGLFGSETYEARNNRSKITGSKQVKAPADLKLIRSYSLQHAKIGLATDYTKRVNVLRLRLESEQFLLEFSNPRDLIGWNLGLTIGRDVSSDIQQREDPRYRTVPRRRRSPYAGSGFYYDAISRRNRSQSDSCYDGKSRRMRNRLSKLKVKLSTPTGFTNLRPASNVPQSGKLQCRSGQNMNENTTAPSSLVQPARNRMRAHSTVSYTSFCDTESENVAGVFKTLPASCANRTIQEDDFYGEDDILNISDLQRSDDEEDFELLLDELQDEMNPLRRKSPQNKIGLDEDKWEPPKKVDSPRKFIKNCLKCIKPLLFDESWVNKVLVRPASISSLSLMYIKNIYCFETPKVIPRCSATLTLPADSDMDLANPDRIGAIEDKSPSKQTMFSLPSVSLARIKNHNLKEYIVGLHSLIPKNI